MTSTEEIKRLVTEFRKAIDEAREADEFYDMFDFRKFPKDCCDMTCDLLGYFLKERGINTYSVNGEYTGNEFEYKRWHEWLETEDKTTIIDITGDQFNKEFNLKEYVLPVHVGNENIVHEMFSLNKQKRQNTEFYICSEFDDNIRKRKLRKLYCIIQEYL